MDGYVPQSPAERQYFDYLWDIANNRAPGSDPSGQGDLSGAAAVQFFQRSSVDRGFLKQIWSLSTPSATMNLQQFYTALRLITMIQNGEIPITKERMIATLKEPLGLPRFTGIDLPAAPKPNVAPAHSVLGPAAVHVGSAQAPVNVAVPPAGAHGLPPFAMTPQEHLKYHALFISYDTNHDGFLSREELLPLFQKSGMDLPRVDLICQMVDEDKDGQLTSKEFCAAFHIIVCVTKRNHAMPPAVPPALLHFLVNAPVLPPNAGAPAAAGVPGVPAVAITPSVIPQVSITAPAVTGNLSVPPTPASGSSAHQQDHHDGFAEFDAPSVSSSSAAITNTASVADSGFPAVTVNSATTPTHASTAATEGSSFDAFDDLKHSRGPSATFATTATSQSAVEDDFFSSHTATVPVTGPSPAPTPAVATASALDFSSAFAPVPPLQTSATANAPAPSTGSSSTGVPLASIGLWTKSTQALVHSQESSLEAQRDVVDSLQKLQQALIQEYHSLDASVARLTDAQAILKAQLTVALEDIERLRVQAGQKRKEIEEATQDNFELQTQLSEAEAQRTQLHQEIEQLSSQLAASASVRFGDSAALAENQAVHGLQTKNALLTKDTSETQRLCLQALQTDIRVLQSCKQTLSKQIQVLQTEQNQQQKQQKQADAQKWQERLSAEKERQVQLQKLHDQQAKEIRRLTEEKQSLLQSMQAQSAALSTSNDATHNQVEANDEDTVHKKELLTQEVTDPERVAIMEEVDSSDSSTASELDHDLDLSHNTSQPHQEHQDDAFGYSAFPETDTAIDMVHPNSIPQTKGNEEAEDAFGNNSSASTGFFGESTSPTATTTAHQPNDANSDDVFGDASSSAFGNDAQAHTEDPFSSAAMPTSAEDPFGASLESDDPFAAAPVTTSSIQESVFDETDAFGASTTSASGGFGDPFDSGSDAIASDDPFAASNNNSAQADSSFTFDVPDKGTTDAFDAQFDAAATTTGPSDDGFGHFDDHGKDHHLTSSAISNHSGFDSAFDATFDSATFGTPATPSTTHQNTTTASANADADDGFAGFDSEDAFAATGPSTESSTTGAGALSSDPFAMPASSSVPKTLPEGFGDDDPFFAPSAPTTPAGVVSGHSNSNTNNTGDEDPFAGFD